MSIIDRLRGIIKKHPSAAYTAAVIVVLAVIIAAMPVSSMPADETSPEHVLGYIPTPPPVPAALPAPQPTPQPAAQETPEETPAPPQMLAHMQELYNQNSDIAGWLTIEGTVVDYPVMYTPDDDENGGFYLYRDFEKNDDKRGTLFIDINSSIDPRSTNLLIHGHNNSDGTMFRTLLSYKKESFYRKHPVFTYSSLYETHEYEIVSVFLSRVYYVDDVVFKFYQFHNAATEQEYNYYIENIKELALYDTGITPKFGDELITLSTCEYSQEHGRLVVVGARKS